MKWKQLIEDLNLFLFYQPNINLKTAQQVISIIKSNMSEVKQKKYLIEFKHLIEYKSTQKSLKQPYDIKKLKNYITRLKGDKKNE